MDDSLHVEQRAHVAVVVRRRKNVGQRTRGEHLHDRLERGDHLGEVLRVMIELADETVEARVRPGRLNMLAVILFPLAGDPSGVFAHEVELFLVSLEFLVHAPAVVLDGIRHEAFDAALKQHAKPQERGLFVAEHHAFNKVVDGQPREVREGVVGPAAGKQGANALGDLEVVREVAQRVNADRLFWKCQMELHEVIGASEQLAGTLRVVLQFRVTLGVDDEHGFATKNGLRHEKVEHSGVVSDDVVVRHVELPRMIDHDALGLAVVHVLNGLNRNGMGRRRVLPSLDEIHAFDPAPVIRIRETDGQGLRLLPVGLDGLQNRLRVDGPCKLLKASRQCGIPKDDCIVVSLRIAMPLERLDEVPAVVPRSLLLDGAHDPDGRHIGELDGRHARSHVGEDVLDDGLGVQKDKGLLQLDVSCGRHENL